MCYHHEEVKLPAYKNVERRKSCLTCSFRRGELSIALIGAIPHLCGRLLLTEDLGLEVSEADP